ncbi:hypothetical protein A2767_06485 [Candidatus Roizmanbacteria bacterium RIFCSPHIGHO2_01_FULL_35_10]|uniref:Uncharacterized protein n=1 Tax=Candidatus Roizmanbacteria bacterium RIFCSPLOWO2_01_FULL_35_13 TaxID=1802055 RepID=A0A1F7IGX9_9BACT|nr:MAG: hypothetical protein A2767_06485 [Candidatus Roizmanbacteria bacterium RIFCSPHIGHO2_01_FULL_35_10]OGK42609.1 MAG: hypothetical protein A3A74_06260 [Candidatus Roizmanbacteria bacterium RIFCSPLOWO2_01_FULL_35_13]
MKKIYFYILTLALVLLLIIGIYFLYSRRNQKENTTLIVPTPNISITGIQEQSISPTLTQEEVSQLESDKEFGIWTQELYDSYPWYDKLPLQSEKYFVYFDINQKKFIASIYSPNEQDGIKNEIILQFKDLGIDYEKYEIIWEIK